MFIELGMFIGLVTFLSLLLPIILLHPNFVSNDLHSEYFRLCMLDGLCYNYSALPFCKSRNLITSECGDVPIKLYLKSR